MIAILLRIILTAALIYGVYTETGIYTAIAFSLLAVHAEASSMLIAKLVDATKDLGEATLRAFNPS